MVSKQETVWEMIDREELFVKHENRHTMNGLIGGLSGKNSYGSPHDDQFLVLKYVSNLIQKYVVSHNDNVDFFIFSWHTDFMDEFNWYLSPKKCKLIPQIDFKIPEHLKNGNVNRVIIAHYSRWYGFKGL